MCVCVCVCVFVCVCMCVRVCVWEGGVRDCICPQYGCLVANKEEIVLGTSREDSVTLHLSCLRVS